ncbi:hypothetical protein ACFPOE_00370 [Caenimonas terrae]|uniref:Uncharacterized protein n=1 Tax=Caenimonas terrae TaxID=696074 RepID=A0ABW0N8V6_9BURK
MDVSLRQWPIFVTGLLLGAAGTMSLGLHHPTQAELAAAAPPVTAARPAATPVAAASAPAAPIAQATPDAGSAERADEQMRAAGEAFRQQEAQAALSAPFAVAVATPPKPRVRRIVKEAQEPVIAASPAAEAPIAIAPTTLAQQSEPLARPRSATSVMGAAPAPAPRREPAEATAQPVQAARGSAHAAEGSDASAQSE